MTDLYQMTWQKKDNDNSPVMTGPILWHRGDNPHWGKEAAPYTYEEALSAAKKWNRLCPTFKHNIIEVLRRSNED